MRSSIATILVCTSLGCGVAAAQEAQFIPEFYPPHIENRISEQTVFEAISFGDEFFIDAARVWPVGTLSVCFFGGSQQLRAKIAAATEQWTNVGASIRLDFGSASNPRLCGPSVFSHIRVGFAYRGYWSTVGQDSITLVPQNEQSMNFALYDINPPPEPIFTQVVLHEFGHALGFKHEHQSYKAPCANEFDWDAIYAYLQGPPNYWTVEQIDHNLRPVTTGDAGTFDDLSIMLYSFPKTFYNAGVEAACYTDGNYALSNDDKAGLLKYYPTDAIAAAAIRADTFAKFEAQIDTLALSTAARDAAKQQAAQILLPMVQFEREMIFIDR